MTSLILKPLSQTDAQELLEFELENRTFFEATIPGRGDAYYSLENVQQTIERSAAEFLDGSSYMYSLHDPSGELVGRINLYDVVRGGSQMAQVGYRVAQKHNGKGYATQAVGEVLKEAFGMCGLHRLEAAVSPYNIGSQVALVKNSFQFWGRARQSFMVNGVWHDSVLFERLESDAPF